MAAKSVVVVDYGMGNVLSVCRAFENQGANVVLTGQAGEIAGAERVVLPGVGAFGDCMKALEERNLVEPILGFVGSGRPFLGICVGMQILMDGGDEFGGYPGLGLFAGRTVQIASQSPDGSTRKIPHIGWTPVGPPDGANDDRWAGTMFEGTSRSTPFYFVHSFTAAPLNAADVLASADYAGAHVTAAIGRDNVTGVQFHPEKSGPAGLALIERFLGL
jgi:imidazole glycerol-phosphate synthase subunit HisH